MLSKALAGLLAVFVGVAGAADPPAVRVARTVRSDPTPGVPVRVPVGRFYPVDLTEGKPALYDTDETLVRIVILKPGERLINQTKFDESEEAQPADYEFPDAKGGVACVFAKATSGTATVKAYANGAGAGPPVKTGAFLIECVVGPRPPPKPPEPIPPGPTPPGPTPPPQPVTSFRVIWVTESASTPTAAQNSVIGAKAVRDYLTAKTTPENGWAGWRHFDPQTNGANEQPTMKALWAAVQAKLTTKDAVVIEVNGKAEILPFPANPAEALATLKKYGGG